MASTAVSVDANALTTRTTALDECSFAARRTARPSTFRIRRSVMTRSNDSLLIASTACSPPSATVTSWPACRSMIARSSRMLRSSSTTSTRVSGTAGGKREGERRAEVRRAVHVDLASVLLDDAMDEGEPETGALRLGGEEGLEDVGEVAGADALPGVAHRDLERITPYGGGHAQLASLRHCLDRIQAEIPQDLPELLGIDGPGDGRRELANDLEAARAGAVLEQEQHLLGGGRNVEGGDRQGRGTRVLEEVLDDVVEPLGLARHDLREALAGDVRRHSPDCRQPIGLTHPRLERADRGEVLTGADKPQPFAVAGTKRGEGHAHGHRGTVRAAQRRLVPRGGSRAAADRDLDRLERRRGAAERRPGATDRLSRRDPDDLLGGAVDRGDPVLPVERDQPGADALEDEVLEGLEVAEILLLCLELLPGGAVPFPETAGDDRHDEERRGVEEHRDQLERRRLLGRVEEYAQREHRAADHDPRVQHGRHRRDGEAARPGQQHAGRGDGEHVQEDEDRARAAGGRHDRGDERGVEQADEPREAAWLGRRAEQEQ